MASDMLIYVMCFTKLEKKSDINLVRGKRAVDIAAEIGDLNFVVHPVSRHICRPCLSLLTQRINHRKKLENLEAKLYNDYCQKARENGMAVKLKHSDKRIPTSDQSSVEVTRKDDMLSYQLALLEYGMLFMNFSDAISQGDGERIIRCWKFFLLFLKNDGQRSNKYTIEGLTIMCQIYALLLPKDAHRLIWNRSVKAKHGLGGNIPLDLALEHYNRVLKEVIKKMGPNASSEKR